MKYRELNEQSICDDYMNGMSKAAIAEKWKCDSITPVKRIVSKYQIPPNDTIRCPYTYQATLLDGTIVAIFNSYTEIGKWLIEQNICEGDDPHHIGIRTRSHMNKNNPYLGFYWLSKAKNPKTDAAAKQQRRRPSRRIAIYCPDLDETTSSIREMAELLLSKGLSGDTTVSNIASSISKILNTNRTYYNLTFETAKGE